jgi:class 3 adenylate cyclase
MNKDYSTTILVSSVTAERCGERFAFRALGSAHPKGRSAELEVYELDGNLAPSTSR